MTIEKINISDIRKQIEDKMGLCNLVVPGVDKNSVENVLDSDEFRDYLQDQIYRWVVKTFLVNAKLQDSMSEEQFGYFLERIKDPRELEGISASVVLSSVPFAGELSNLQFVSIDSEEKPISHLSAVAH